MLAVGVALTCLIGMSIYNRGTGGYATLYFMDPEAQTPIRLDEEERKTRAFEGLSAN